MQNIIKNNTLSKNPLKRHSTVLSGVTFLGLALSATCFANNGPTGSLSNISHDAEIDTLVQKIADPQGDGITTEDLVVKHNQDFGTDGEATDTTLAPLLFSK